jgi:hypothetical protein
MRSCPTFHAMLQTIYQVCSRGYVVLLDALLASGTAWPSVLLPGCMHDGPMLASNCSPCALMHCCRQDTSREQRLHITHSSCIRSSKQVALLKTACISDEAPLASVLH